MKLINRGVRLVSLSVNKRLFAAVGCTLFCAGIITGCSILSGVKLDKPYTFENSYTWVKNTPPPYGQRQSQETSSTSIAEPFAHNLCVVDGVTQDSDTTVTSEAAAVFGISDRSVIYNKHAFEKLYPASTTKIMTAMIAIKYGNLDDKVTVTDAAVITEAGSTLCGIKPGDQLTMRQLLYGLILPSGNDAGAAIAVHMAGSIDKFSDLMNQEAKSLGATGTHFTNPHGLNNENHYTTAYDLYLIFNEALQLPEFRTVTGTTSYAAKYTDGAGMPVTQIWKGGNWYLTGEKKTPEGLKVFSGKTGTTRAAGYCLIMASQDSQDKEYISVILKAGSRPGLYDNMTNIISKIVN